MSNRLLLNCLLFGLIAASLYSLHLLTTQQVQTTVAQSANPDSYAKHIVLTQYNDNGTLQAKLKAPLLRHYQSQDITLFEQPTMMGINKDARIWHLRSQHARSHRGFSSIDLWDNVLLQQPGDARQPSLAIQTQTLTYYPTKQYAQTKADVLLTQPGISVRAQGMQAYLADKRVELLQQARGTYDAQQ